MSEVTIVNRPVVDISFIVPMYNAEEKFSRCVASLRELEAALPSPRNGGGNLSFEAIFIDDCSTDATFALLSDAAEAHDHWYVLQTPRNSGSPSAPRNLGLRQARGRYVFFLDGDDEVNGEGIRAALELADGSSHDVVRGPVLVHYLGEDRRVLIDRMSPDHDASAAAMLELIAREQSLNCSALWRKDLLIEHQLAFDESVKMGEDIVFTAQAMSQAQSIGYVDTPLFHYLRQPGGGNSSMHYYSGRELRELVTSWQTVEDCFLTRGLSYFELHGEKTINYALRLVFRYHDRGSIGSEDMEDFCDFFVRNSTKLSRLKFADAHVADFVSVVSIRGASAFWEMMRPRLLIAGHDLKFIKSAVPLLREWFEVRVDEWPSEIMHDERQSKQLLAWADYVWVEWLTAASVWYAEHVRPTQKLVVRMHRYELGRSYGDQIPVHKVGAFVAIAPHCLEDMIERFSFDRAKVHYIPNFYQVDSYDRSEADDEGRLFRLAVIGAVPRRKGLLRALELLRSLREIDQRYTLSILGKEVSEMPWIAWDPHEQAYFAACEEFVRENGMDDAVTWVGWTDVRKEARKYGFVLSTSEHEGSHVGPGEAYCAGNQGIFLRWRGAEFVYPEEQVFDTVEQMASHVLRMRDLNEFNVVAEQGREFMKDSYDIGRFIQRVRRLFQKVG
ncbi:glycosyltransferase [Brachybacterium sp. AOP42-C2-15]|uniref:glycosyltransferase n=1 Tax=Brachybacterium sp. AOP42-C2-15 TaxID=3457670 RepID=UPI00403457A6